MGMRLLGGVAHQWRRGKLSGSIQARRNLGMTCIADGV